MNKSKLSGCDILTLMFIYLQLTNQIDWSWWQVLLPFIFEVILWPIGLGIYDGISERRKRSKDVVEDAQQYLIRNGFNVRDNGQLLIKDKLGSPVDMVKLLEGYHEQRNR